MMVSADTRVQVKLNIGHSEAASGIFAVMKAALMTEAGVIPGVAHF
jgi:acyl transferase domain-containing protein